MVDAMGIVRLLDSQQPFSTCFRALHSRQFRGSRFGSAGASPYQIRPTPLWRQQTHE
jgi:hypothetical protein